MAHACRCSHGSPVVLGETLPPARAEQRVGEAAASAGASLDALLVALNETREAPA